jgi:hypothetical protein
MRWEQMGAFGTGLLFIDSDKKNTIRYKCIDLKSVTLGQNHQGIVNRVCHVLSTGVSSPSAIPTNLLNARMGRESNTFSPFFSPGIRSLVVSLNDQLPEQLGMK